MIGLPVLGMLVFAATTSRAQNRSPIAEQIAKSYGLDSFGQIEGIRYTFNADLGKVKVSRSWVWEPKIDRRNADEMGDPAFGVINTHHERATDVPVRNDKLPSVLASFRLQAR